MSQVNLVLDKLKEINEQKGENIFLPSLGKKVKFRPFTLKQQKFILSKIPNDTSGLLSFFNNFNDVIIENCTIPLKLENLNSFDRLSVLLAYRISAVGNSYTSGDKKISLTNVTKKIQTADYKKIFSEKEVKNANYSVVVAIPSLQYDVKINNSTINKLKKSTTDASLLAEMFNAEILKYLKKVVIFGEENIVLDMYDTEYNDKVNIIDTLPNSVTKKVMNNINIYKKSETDLTTIDNITIDVTNELFS